MKRIYQIYISDTDMSSLHSQHEDVAAARMVLNKLKETKQDGYGAEIRTTSVYESYDEWFADVTEKARTRALGKLTPLEIEALGIMEVFK
jgi:hypothetical protein